jgi:hypothetical protein
VSDIVLEFTATSSDRFQAWQNVLQEVGFAGETGPAHGQPGYEEHQQQAAQALHLLQPHLDGLARRVDTLHPHVLAQMESIQRSLEDSKEPASSRRLGDVSLDLSHVMNSIEVLLLGLIGPEGQSPVAFGHIEIPTQPYFEAWLTAATGCKNLIPNIESTQTIAWRTDRAYLFPGQAQQAAAFEAREVPFEMCCDVLRRWNAGSTSQGWIGATDPAERHRYEDWQPCFTEGLVQLQAGLSEIADRGEIYLGWTTWYGYE